MTRHRGYRSADVMAAAAIADCAKSDRTVTLMSTFEYDRAVLESTCAAAISPPRTSHEVLRPSFEGMRPFVHLDEARLGELNADLV